MLITASLAIHQLIGEDSQMFITGPLRFTDEPSCLMDMASDAHTTKHPWLGY